MALCTKRSQRLTVSDTGHHNISQVTHLDPFSFFRPDYFAFPRNLKL